VKELDGYLNLLKIFYKFIINKKPKEEKKKDKLMENIIKLINLRIANKFLEILSTMMNNMLIRIISKAQ